MVGCTCLWYMLITNCLVQVGAWLMHLFMVHVEVQVDVCYMMARVVTCLLVHVYISTSHSDSVIVVPSFYFYFRVVVRGKDRWF